MEKLLHFARTNKLLLLLLFAFLLRMYHFQELFYYGHDNDLAGWFLKDVLIDHHPRLIGQETSTRGIFIGPLFYYLQIPFYLLTGLDPVGATFLVAFIGAFCVWSIYFVFSKIWNTNIGFIGGLIYAVSFSTLLSDREVVPTMPVVFWTVWFLYGLWLLLERKQKWAFPVFGILLGLIWHINFALVLLTPLVPIAFLLAKKNENKSRFALNIKSILLGIALCFLLSLPLFAFEFRHDFQQSYSLLSALTTDQQDIVSGGDKIVRTFHLASKNVTNLLWGSLVNIKYEFVHIAMLLLFAALIIKKRVDQKVAVLMFLWVLCFMTFFSLYSKILSEYYLNGMLIVYIALFAVIVSSLIESKKWKNAGIIALCVFVVINLYRFFTIPINKSGYLYRKAVISEIKRDSAARGYPCVSLSYIVSPGNDLGYRYFVWRSGLKTKPVSNSVPVYSIVFPMKPIFQEDISFGAIGLIYPDYSRYTDETVKMACEGRDWNLEEPMFGFTK